jgi:hypothetical protein
MNVVIVLKIDQTHHKYKAVTHEMVYSKCFLLYHLLFFGVTLISGWFLSCNQTMDDVNIVSNSTASCRFLTCWLDQLCYF